MTESEVRKLLRQMKELDSQTAFRDFYNMTYDRLFRIAYYYVKQEEWSQEIVLDVFLKKNQNTLTFILILCLSHRNRAIHRKNHSLVKNYLLFT